MGDSRKHTLRRKFYDGWTGLASSVIGLVFPGRAASFCRQRSMLLSYKAASRKGPDRMWRGDNRSADSILLKDWKEVTGRAREMVQNSSYIAGAIEKICNNVVYTGITPQAQLKKVDDSHDNVRNEAVEAHWKRWAESEEVRFADVQDLAVRHLWTDGEFLIHHYVDPDMLDKGLVPLRLELIEADHFDATVHGELPNGNYARRGIEFNRKGDPVAYHLYVDHPGNTGVTILRKSRRISADQIIHVFKRQRISQTRGISWLVSIIMRMRGLEEFEDSELIAARLTSAFAFFMESPYPEYNPQNMGGHLPGYEQFTASAPTAGAEVPEFVEAGRIQQIPAGAKVHSEGYQRPGDQFEPFTKHGLRGGSTGMGMSFEAFSNNYSEATYSSARSGSLEERRGYRRQQGFLNDKLNSPVWKLFCRVLYLSSLQSDVGLDIPVTWQTPGWPWVDPYKDAQAASLKLKLGITNRQILCGELGLDHREVAEQLAIENADLSAKGIIKEEQHAQ